MKMTFNFLLTLFTLFIVSNAGKVLIYNLNGPYSHFIFPIKLADLLVEAGHNVTIFFPELDPQVVKVETKANVIIRAPPHTNIDIGNKPDDQEMFWSSKSISIFSVINMIKLFWEIQNEQCERLFADEEFAQMMRDEKFEIGMLEPIDPCGTMYFKHINVTNYVTAYPTAIFENFGTMIGLPGRSHCSFLCNDWLPTMNIRERITNFFMAYLTSFLFTVPNHWIDISARYNLNYTYAEGVAGARYMFFNTEEHMDFPRPINHKIVYIGGITVAHNTDKELSAEFKNLFDNAEKVVIVSFGSVIKSTEMPKPFLDAFLAMFKAFPELTFIWKYENPSENPAAHLSNVVVSAWVPQKDILAHPKTVAFITHGGMNSITEVAHAGVPVVAIPLFSDQPRNAKMLEYRKTAVIVEKADISTNTLIAAMKTVISPEYQKRASDLAAVIASKPVSPKQRFLSYFDHALKQSNTPDFLDMETRHFYTYRYYDLDLVFGALLIVSVLLYVLWRLGKFVVNLVTRRSVKVKEN